MTRIVQKYGGSSVASPAQVLRVAARVVEARRAGHDVTVVVSAMGGSTDRLLSLAGEVTDHPPRRELDLLLASGEQVSCSLLAMALQAKGQAAVALTGPQGGIRTHGPHGCAQIRDVDSTRVEAELAEGRVVVVAGFQGQASDGEVTTLGRGGSDTTAIALAAALDAERCQILSDVDGVYTADPRVVPQARRLERISYPEMAELARHGARVLNEQAVRLAARSGVTVEAGSSFQDGAGTLVGTSRPAPAGADGPRGARGIASRAELLRVRAALPEPHGELASELGDALAPLEILHRDAGVGRRPLEMVACTENEPEPTARAQQIRKEFGRAVHVTNEVSAVTAVGLAVGRRTASVERTHAALSARGIAVDGVHRSDHSVTCLVPPEQLDPAMRTLHAELVEANWAGEAAAG